jgi:hypothetical protein
MNADFSVPVISEFSFFGYLDNTDEEIRIESCFGAGYDAGYWYDDFQNYLTEAPGNPYIYYFYNDALNQGYVLSDVIPDNSFQPEDIILEPVIWPEAPSGFSGFTNDDFNAELSWDVVPGQTYRIYRRSASSNGSFFRVDDILGSQSNPGVSESPYIDNTVIYGSSYHYFLISRDSQGNFSPHSSFIHIDVADYICGDADNNGEVDILDILLLIDYKFKGGPPPLYFNSSDVNSDGIIDIIDLLNFIDFKFLEGPPLYCP